MVVLGFHVCPHGRGTSRKKIQMFLAKMRDFYKCLWSEGGDSQHQGTPNLFEHQWE